ncbi:D-alanyl-D-alanine carboxypeptidase/D-alanyl-D-alanine-endopeptidase [Streptomyces sp. TRM 70351]|nr:D-alanyl-D-alanine carboxypeptidase/D-alanyl-D-alanine-endopeptidase [Streptomyces sp. TRM 70351]MEE1930354.1 D-alanyl-D-alanine carboxypeptidase/D-alanyl-D-alanine-endopeptidase [Streptomyces sp. TRM 70351]
MRHTEDARPGAAEPERRPAPAPSARAVLGPAGAADTAPTRAGLTAALRPLLDAPALGDTATGTVVDTATGRTLFDSGGGRAVVPASTVKLATGAAALTVLGPDHRLATRAVWDEDGRRVVLVGGGDPTLTGDRLARLAEATAAAVRKRGLAPRAVGYDVSRYRGPKRHPIGVNDNLAPLTPLMLNAARTDGSTRGPAPRAADPAAEAADAFAALLAEAGVRTGRTGPARAPGDAPVLGTDRSAPMAALVERMLTHSDNDLAEALARHTALAVGEPADFTGTRAATRKVLDSLGLPVDGTVFADGSGLSRDSRVSARLLAALLSTAARPAHPELRPLLTGLPVAGFTGTLSRRYAADGTTDAAGLVRAKTGTLTGVNTLAGQVVDAEGRLLSFAFLTTGTTDARGAQDALDRLAAAVAACGCR